MLPFTRLAPPAGPRTFVWPLVLPSFGESLNRRAATVCVCVCVCVCLRVYATRQKGHLSLTCPCRAQHGCGLALAPCRGGGSPGRGLGEGDAWGLTGVPRLGDWNLGGQALGCGRVEPCPELSPTKFRASKTQ